MNKTIKEEREKIEETKQAVLNYESEESFLDKARKKCAEVLESIWAILCSPYAIVVGGIAMIAGAYVGLKCAKTGACGPGVAVFVQCTC